MPVREERITVLDAVTPVLCKGVFYLLEGVTMGSEKSEND